MTDRVCEEKAILVLRGNDTTVRNLTLQRARVPDGNGAGIRLENQNLTVNHLRFKNNQVGILSGSKFIGIKGGQISTAAEYSVIVDNEISGGTGDAGETSNYAVLGTGGALLMERNIITVGPLVPRPGAAIGVWDDGMATLRSNKMINSTGQSIAVLQNWSWSNPTLQDNVIGVGDSLTSSSGIWRHRMSTQYYLRTAQLHDFASQTKQVIKHLFGR